MTADTLRLLIVDDDEGNRITLAALLEDEGFAVEMAASAEEARGLLGEGGFHAVILDQHLGDGLGSEVAADVRSRLPAAAVLMMSGSSSEEEIRSAGPAFDAWFVKGADVERMIAWLKQRYR